MTTAELLDLLREARESVFRDSLCREYDDSQKTAAMEEHRRRTRLLDRIDAALAERQDSAKDVVEWRPSDQRVFLDGVSLRIVYQTGGLWMWSVYWPLSHRTEQGQVATEEEAKQAAIAAARGLR